MSRHLIRSLVCQRLIQLGWGSIFLLPVLVPVYLARSVSPASIFILQSSFFLVSAVFQIPTGLLSDRLGHARAIRLAALTRFAGFLVFVFAGDFPEFLVAQILLGLANSLMSGAETALMLSTYEALGKADRFREILSESSSLVSIGSLSSLLVGSLLSKHSLELVLYVNAAFALVPVVLSFGLIEPAPTGSRTSRLTLLRNVTHAARDLAARPRRITVLIYILASLTFQLAYWASQIRWTELGVPASSFGLLLSLLALAQIAFNSLIKRHTRRSWERPAVVFLLLSVGALSLAMRDLVALLILSLPLYLARSVAQIIYRDQIVRGCESGLRAISQSMISLIIAVLVGVSGALAGRLITRYGASAVSVLLLILIGTIASIAWPAFRPGRREGEDVERQQFPGGR